MTRPTLVLFVEGKGDVAAVPKLAARVSSAVSGFEVISVDAEPFVVQNLGKLVKDDCKEWRRWLSAAQKTRRSLGGILLVLDGDLKRVPGTWTEYIRRFGTADFCECRVSALLAEAALSVQGGTRFSVAVVFAMREFESWILAGVEGLRGAALGGGRGSVSRHLEYPSKQVESVRDAKSLLRNLIPEYSESLDQAVLAAKLDLQMAAERSRSFRRFQHAVHELIFGLKNQKHFVSPSIVVRPS